MDELMVKRGYITKTSEDDKNYHVAQASYHGQVADIEVITPYGLYSTLPLNADLVIMNINGCEENRVALGNTPNTRFKNLLPGEVVVGSPQTTCNIKFKEDGNIIVTGKNGTTVTIDKDGNISFDVKGDFNLNATGNVVINAANIELNGNSRGVARLNDAVSGGVIVSASSTVKTG